jgi:hypothetical protein
VALDVASLAEPFADGIAGCCARAASGHAVAAPSSVMNWRRFKADMGSHRPLSLARRDQAILEATLNRSEIGRARCVP